MILHFLEGPFSIDLRGTPDTVRNFQSLVAGISWFQLPRNTADRPVFTQAGSQQAFMVTKLSYYYQVEMTIALDLVIVNIVHDGQIIAIAAKNTELIDAFIDLLAVNQLPLPGVGTSCIYSGAGLHHITTQIEIRNQRNWYLISTEIPGFDA